MSHHGLDAWEFTFFGVIEHVVSSRTCARTSYDWRWFDDVTGLLLCEYVRNMFVRVTWYLITGLMKCRRFSFWFQAAYVSPNNNQQNIANELINNYNKHNIQHAYMSFQYFRPLVHCQNISSGWFAFLSSVFNDVECTFFLSPYTSNIDAFNSFVYNFPSTFICFFFLFYLLS